jgi:hypothetical protein
MMNAREISSAMRVSNNLPSMECDTLIQLQPEGRQTWNIR